MISLFSKKTIYNIRVFIKGRNPAKLVGYSTWTHRLFDWEITSHLTINMRNIYHKTWALDRPRFIQEKQKNFAEFWVISVAICVSCSFQIYPNSCSTKQGMHSKRPNFQYFSGGAYPWTPLQFSTFGASSSFSTYFYNFATYWDSYWKPCNINFVWVGEGGDVGGWLFGQSVS